jgi:hypothetical protein
MEQDKGHAKNQEKDGENCPNDDQHCSFPSGHTGMTQKHELGHGTSRRPRRQQGQKVIAENYLHSLIKRNPLMGNLHQVHKPAAVKKHAQGHGCHSQSNGPGLESIQILQRVYVYSGVDNHTRNYQNQQDKAQKPAVKFIHAKAPSCLRQPKLSSWLA